MSGPCFSIFSPLLNRGSSIALKGAGPQTCEPEEPMEVPMTITSGDDTDEPAADQPAQHSVDPCIQRGMLPGGKDSCVIIKVEAGKSKPALNTNLPAGTASVSNYKAIIPGSSPGYY